MIQLAFYLLILPTKLQNWFQASAFSWFLLTCLKFMKLCRTNIKKLLMLQQDVTTYTGKLMYGVRLQVNVGNRLTKKCFSALLHCSENKKLRKKGNVSDGHFREGSLNFNFSIASINSNYIDILSFPKKLKFDDTNIFTKFLIREQKIIHNCPSDTLTLIYLKSYAWMVKYFAFLKYGRKLQIF